MRNFIELKDVAFSYELPNRLSIPALKGISLEIETGEYVAIIGANGSGKSTLARHLNALLVPQQGYVQVMGYDTYDRANHRKIRGQVGMVFQRPEDQIVATTITEDIAFGLENIGVPTPEIRDRVHQALELMGLWEERHRPPYLLSAGQMQRVALAGILAMRPQCIIFDEATAMLDPLGRRTIREMMARLHKEGLTIITITHFMEEAVEAERVIVLNKGTVALDAPPASVFSDVVQLAELGLALPPAGGLAKQLCLHFPELPPNLLTPLAVIEALDALPHSFDITPIPISKFTEGTEKTIEIAVDNLGHTYMQGTPLAHRALEGVTLAIAHQEAHGILGATGSGKSTLMQHLNGLLRPQEGTVQVGNYDLNDPRTDLKAVRRMVGLAFQIPELQIFEQYVGDEIAYGPRLFNLQREELRERVRWAMLLVGLDFETYKDRLTFTLSGGERRKVALASILALWPRILLLDEPTAGLDPQSRQELLGHLRHFSASGMTLVLSSHQMEDLAILTTQLTVMKKGSTVLHGSVREVFGQVEHLRELGLGLPVITQVVAGLRQRGWVLPAGIITLQPLVEHIKRARV
ncbi:MAG: energy-coupling factor transporter ATPase [Anaerolineae bacterium]|nr:energy-coupling factor transporter ATPase [Anaerolineae bacterium]